MLIAVASAFLVACATAAGAAVEPRALVLHPADAPAGFKVDPGSTRYVTNAAAIRTEPTLKERIERSGRITGYFTTYNARVGARVHTIISASHVMKTSAGAAIWLRADDAQQRALNRQRSKTGAHVYTRQTVVLGNQGWTYWMTTPRYTLVEWRVGRVVGIVTTWGLTRDQTITLARKQVQNIRTALG